MRITWITRSFLDYRIPMYEEIDRLCGYQLTVIYFAEVVPLRCQKRLENILEDRAIGLKGEVRLTGKKSQPLSNIKKNGIRIPFQPGLVQQVKKSKPEVILSDGFFQWSYAALWMKYFKDIPNVMCYEGTKHTERNSGWIRFLYRKFASKFIDRIACNGILSAEYIESLGFPRDKISLGNMTADISGLQKSSISLTTSETLNLKTDLRLNENVFLFTGRLVPLKGVDKLITVWLETFKNNNETSLLIVGDGPERKSLKKKIEKEQCTNVCLVGSIEYTHIHKYFAIADIFVIPTLQDNWSLVVPEAMSTGLPILSSQFNGCWPELVKPQNGWIFNPLDSYNFQQILLNAWKNRKQWPQMGQASIEIVEQHSPAKMAHSIYQTCKTVV